MLEALKALLASRKALATFAVLLAASLAVFFGRMDVEQASSLAKFLIPALVLAIAGEDIGKAVAAGTTSPTTSVEVSVPAQSQVTETPTPLGNAPKEASLQLPLPTGPFGPEKPL